MYVSSPLNLDLCPTNKWQCYRSAWQYASSFSTSLSTPSADSHIVALHQALIPNWTSPAFSKFVDATRALVDELANITTTRDGKEEMVRCEEIFRQICWLEERFWPDVDGMGEEDESARLVPQVGLGGMENGTFTGPMNQNMGGPMNNNTMGNQMNGQMSNNGLNGQMSGPMNNTSMNGSLSSALSGAQMNGPSMNGNINGTQMNGGDGTPGPDGSNNFGQMSQIGQSS